MVVGAIIRKLALAGACGHEAAIAGTTGQGAGGEAGPRGICKIHITTSSGLLFETNVGEWNRHIDRVVVVGIKKPSGFVLPVESMNG